MKNLKKTLAVISSAVMLCCSIAPTIASAEGYQFIKDKYTAEEALAAGYDFNLDGIVSYKDCDTLLLYYTWSCLLEGDEKITDFMDATIVEAVETYGDITGDGIIDPQDATAFLVECYSIIRNGDVNQDGILDPTDATAILSHYCNVSLDNEEYKSSQDFMTVKNIGDINKDGKVDPTDATEVLSIWALNSVS